MTPKADSLILLAVSISSLTSGHIAGKMDTQKLLNVPLDDIRQQLRVAAEEPGPEVRSRNIRQTYLYRGKLIAGFYGAS